MRAAGGINGRTVAASDKMSVRVPSFETLLELDGYLTGCYNGYRAELQGGRERRRIIGGGRSEDIAERVDDGHSVRYE